MARTAAGIFPRTRTITIAVAMLTTILLSMLIVDYLIASLSLTTSFVAHLSGDICSVVFAPGLLVLSHRKAYYAVSRLAD